MSWLQDAIAPWAQAWNGAKNWWQQPITNTFAPVQQALNGAGAFWGGTAQQATETLPAGLGPNGETGTSGWNPDLIPEYQRRATAAGLSPAEIDHNLHSMSYEEALANLEPREQALTQLGRLNTDSSSEITRRSNELNRLSGIGGGDVYDGTGTIMGTVARDPNKMLTDAQYGSVYSAGKAAYDQLADLGKQQQREQEASRTGGAITGRGLAANHAFDIARSQGLSGLSSGILRDVQNRATGAGEDLATYKSGVEDTRRGLESGVPISADRLAQTTGRTLTNRGLANETIGNTLGFGQQQVSNILSGLGLLANNPITSNIKPAQLAGMFGR